MQNKANLKTDELTESSPRDRSEREEQSQMLTGLSKSTNKPVIRSLGKKEREGGERVENVTKILAFSIQET